VDLANTAYTNNGITLQLNLVGTQLLSESGAAESVDISTALEYISGTTGSCSSANYPSPPQTVKSLRDSYNADLVSLLRAYDGTGAYCGLAWTMTSLTSSCDPYFGYSVVEVRDATSGGYYCDEITLAHETGHNMGASHDRTTGCSGLFPYSCGYYTSDQRYGTIMSYLGNTIVTYFSSPSASYSGYTLGVSDTASNSADNASTINSSKSVVANYRYSSTVTCTYTISPASQTVAASGGSGSISVTASSSSCAWTATASDSWLTISSGSSGTGSGTVNYSVYSNATGASRTGTITIGGQTFTITQSGTITTALTHTLTAPSNSNVSRGSIFGPIVSSITNNSSSTITGYLWASVYTPKGSWVDTIYVPLTLSAGQSMSNNGIMRLIPSLADTGAYSFCEYIYNPSWTELDHKCVSFNVQ
ncbi:MAG: hypothetical protein HQL08_15035, partial [Nitrospirae bacterium]|nr:hypothetical protein [Nitrospirota bacterium]